MFGRDDFLVVQQRWDAYWTEQNKRPVYAITVPKNGNDFAPRPTYMMGFNGDFQGVADTLARWADSCEFYGEGYAYYGLSFGADDFAAFLGADLKLSPNGDTSWPVHTLTSLKGAKIAFQKDGKWFTRLCEFHHTLKATLGDRVMLVAPTLTAGLDAVVGLYGAINLLTDMVDDPETVHEALAQVDRAYTDIFNACAELFDYKTYGSATRHGMYTTKAAGVPQCDFSCMISPAMFEEFAVPSITHEFSRLTGGEYHLDGPDAIRHLERLVKIPRLHTVQWVPGAGNAENVDWMPLYQRIAGLGKALILHGNPTRVEEFERVLNTNKLFFSVGGLKTRAQAEDFLARAEKRWEGIK